MPKAPNQDMFPMEQCKKCNVDGILHLTLRGKYLWRCGDCLDMWRTPGSELVLVNAILGPVDYDKPAGLIVEENNRAKSV